jgi:hypothetical protein
MEQAVRHILISSTHGKRRKEKRERRKEERRKEKSSVCGARNSVAKSRTEQLFIL